VKEICAPGKCLIAPDEEPEAAATKSRALPSNFEAADCADDSPPQPREPTLLPEHERRADLLIAPRLSVVAVRRMASGRVALRGVRAREEPSGPTPNPTISGL
jgi:hypothetical protein